MKTIALDKYTSFQCLAGACTSTCCAGWSILIDEKDYRRFENMEPEWLREDVLTNVQKRGSQYYFRNDAKGRCAMLDEDGLCRIQRNTSEEMLCNTCRKYPRLVNSIGEKLYLSMAASCPVISEYLVTEETGWLLFDDSGKGKGISLRDVKLVSDAWSVYREYQKAAKVLQRENENKAILYACFERMTAGILDIVLKYQDKTLSIDAFQVMEEDISVELEGFLQTTQSFWETVVENYMQYRILSRKMEFPEEADNACVRRALGDLFLLRTLAFCRYGREGAFSEKELPQLLQKVYRFSAHGKKVAEAFQKFVDAFFSQDILWNYVLL